MKMMLLYFGLILVISGLAMPLLVETHTLTTPQISPQLPTAALCSPGSVSGWRAGQARNRVGSAPEGSALARSVRLGPASAPWHSRSDIVGGDAHPFPLIIAGSMDEIDVLGLARQVIA